MGGNTSEAVNTSPIQGSPSEINNTSTDNENSQAVSNENNENDQSIIAQKEIQDYIKEIKNIYQNLREFFEFSENSEEDFKNLIILTEKKEDNRDKLEKFLQLITNIANNFHRDESLFKKIFQIIEHYTTQIKQTFSNYEIFNIFESNKKITLFLFKKGIITIDDIIYNELLLKIESNGDRYCFFFYPEIKEYAGEEEVKLITKDLLNIDQGIFECFEEKREEGENDTFICSIIRKDSVEEFISYVNRKNIPLDRKINHSIFETNSFLNENKDTKLIEYAAFFGSIQIFQYLLFNNVELRPSLWLYAIHSRNPELFHLLETNKVELPSEKFEKCFCECIKCHHNEFAEYIETNFLNDEIIKKEQILKTFFQFHNYAYFPIEIENGEEFFYFSINSFHKVEELFIKMKEESIKKNLLENNITFEKAANDNQIEIIYYLLLNETIIKDDVFNENKKINKIVIPSSIKFIGNYAFSLCSRLTQISIPSSVTSIGDSAFYECSSLIQITIPSSVTSIGDSAFYGCSSLTQVIIPSSVTSIGNYAFYECSSLKQIRIPYSVISIEFYCFDGCSSLKQIIIPSSVTSIGDYAFHKCSKLKRVTIPSSVTSIGEHAFYECSKLKRVTIPSSVTSIGYHAFYYCYKLRRVTIPSSLNYIGKDVFHSYIKIKKI